MDDADDSELMVEDLPAARRTLRVAIVTESYPPEINGVALTVARIIQGLHEREHNLQLVRPRQPAATDAQGAPLFEQVLLRGLPVPRYPQLRMGLPSTRALMQLWSRRRPDVVHIATEGPLGWSAVRAAERLRLPTVSDFRTNFQLYSGHYGLGWLRKPIESYLRKFHNRTDATTVPTEALALELQRLGLKRLKVIPRGVDARRFDPARRDESLRRSWGATDASVVLLCVSRLAPEKNLGLLLDCFERLRGQGADVRLVLVGDGPLREDLRARSPSACFAGQQTGDALAAHYASADLFVFPSLSETFGNVTIEAMASGLPVVAFRHAAAATLIQTRLNGWLAPPQRPQDFVDAVLEACADPALRRSCGHSARATVEAMDWDAVIDRIEALLTAVAARATQGDAREGRDALWSGPAARADTAIKASRTRGASAG